MMKNLIHILLVVVCIGCNQQPALRENLLKGDIMQTDSLFNGSYFYCMENDYALMKSYDADSMIYVTKIKGDSLISQYSFLAKGQGPDEANHYYIGVEDSMLTIIDYAGSFNKGFRTDYRSRELLQAKWQRITFSSSVKEYFTSGSSRFSVVNDSVILFLGGRDNHPEILSVYNLYTGKVSPIDYWPDDAFSSNNHLKQKVYIENAFIFKQKKRNRYLYQSGNGRVVMLFNLHKGKIDKQHYIYKIFPQYEFKSDGLNYQVKYSDEKSFETLDISVSEKYIYMMVSPHIQDKPYKGCPYYYGDKVIVFDWEGKWIREFTTNIPFYSFEVDKNDEYLYSMGFDIKTGGDIVIRYKIN